MNGFFAGAQWPGLIRQGIEVASRPPLREGGAAGVFLVLAPVIVALHFYVGTLRISQINQDRSSSDQQHNIELARESVEEGDWLPKRTSGVVNPLWPWLSGKLLLRGEGSEMDDPRLFQRGKYLNLALTGIFLGGLLIWSGHTFGLLPAILFPLLASMGSLAERAPYFQPEPLYYMLLFLAGLMAVKILCGNKRVWDYALLGAFAGLAYLAKSAVTPMLAGFVGISLLPLLVGILPRIPGVSTAGLAAQKARFGFWRHVAGMALLLAVFAVVILPRAMYSARVFGDPLHSFPKYWMWQDDFGTESTPFMQNFAEHQQRAAAGDETALPSLGNYLRTHSPQQVQDRLTSGFTSAVGRFFLPEKTIKKRNDPKPWRHVLQYRGLYLAALAGLSLALALSVLTGSRFFPGAQKLKFDEVFTSLILAGFVIGTFLTYAAAFGWYEPIGKGDRFMLSLYLPLLGFLVWGSEKMQKKGKNIFVGKNWLIAGVSLVIYGVILWEALGRALDLAAFPWFKP